MLLSAEGISRKYMRQTKNSNYFYAVQKTDFAISQGSIVEIVGRSGSGKSTFLSMISGMLKPTEGRIFLKADAADKNPTDIYKMDDASLSRFRNKNFGVIPQVQSGLNGLSVVENVMLPALVYGEENPELKEKAIHLLEKVGIKNLQNEKPGSLSGGELRRMSIARSLINSPAFIFADEPTGDLDDENTHNVLSLLKNIAKEENVGILLVTHETDAAKYADAIYTMAGGVLKIS